jgi:hypothetical protein
MVTRRGRPTQGEAKQFDLAVREAAVATFVEIGSSSGTEHLLEGALHTVGVVTWVR